MQFDEGHLGIGASDSSDRSKSKMDQKVNIDISILQEFFVLLLNRSVMFFLVYCNQQTLRRLAQNREAARKSRLRKKVCLDLCFIVSISFYVVFYKLFPNSKMTIGYCTFRHMFSS